MRRAIAAFLFLAALSVASGVDVEAPAPTHDFVPLNLGLGVDCFRGRSGGLGGWRTGDNHAAARACRAVPNHACRAWKAVGGQYLLLAQLRPYMPTAAAAKTNLGICFQPSELAAENARDLKPLLDELHGSSTAAPAGTAGACVVSEWVDVGECTAKCGGTGVRAQKRHILKHPSGGNSCPELHRELPCDGAACAVNCVLSAWQDEGECSAACGYGTKQQHRTVDVAAANGGHCPQHLERTVACNEHACPVECQVSEWHNAGVCSKKCGGGVQQQTRRVIKAAAHGGACPFPLARQLACNEQECPVDCVVSHWHKQGKCSEPCGGTGKRQEVRTVLRQPAHGGKTCPSLSRMRACNKQPCKAKPVDCQVGPWSNVGSCTATCGGGIQLMQRRLIKRARHGGSCPRLRQTEACNTHACPLNCQLSAWRSVGACSRECGGGVQREERRVEAPAQNGGSCTDLLQRERPCNTHACPGDCQFSEWHSVGTCSQPCGSGSVLQRRTITRAATNGGACDATERTAACNERACPEHCQVSDWRNEGECSHPCGAGGRQRQVRTVVMPAANGGACPEKLERLVACNEHIPCTKNCKVADWAPVSGPRGHCSVKCGGGVRFEFRKVLRSAEQGGECPYQLARQVACNEQSCAADCVVGAWHTEGECSKTCGGGTLKQTREISVPALHGGKCPRLERTLKCNVHACPRDCTLGAWQNEGTCSQPCGPGVQSQVRKVLKPAAHGGACPSAAQHRHVPCQIKACAQPCSLTAWHNEGACSKACGGGQQKQTRTVVHAAANGGKCVEPLTQHVLCNAQPCPIDCTVSEWQNSGVCSHACGGGVQTQIRVVRTPAENGGSCPPLERVMECNAHACPVDCQTSDWADIGECSAKCGGGLVKQKRIVTAPAKNGGACDASLERELECNTHACPNDCTLSAWQIDPARPCSRACGGGVRPQTRTVLVAATGSGKCAADLERLQECNTHACPRDCEVSEWKSHGECSQACGGGEVEQRRVVLADPKHGGLGCPALRRMHECNTQPCADTKCPTTAWQPAVGSRCSKACGGGERRVERHLIEPLPQCRHVQLVKTVRCNRHACPRDCQVSPWQPVGACSKTCGGGVQRQTRSVQRSSKNGGACPRTARTVACNTQACVEVVAVNAGRECWSAKTDIGYVGFRTLGAAARVCERTAGCAGLRSSGSKGKRAHFWMLSQMLDAGEAPAHAGVQCFAASFDVAANARGAIRAFHSQSLPASGFEFQFSARAARNAVVALLQDSAVVRADELHTRAGYTVTLSGAASTIHATHAAAAEAAADTNANLATVDERAAALAQSAAEMRPFWVRLTGDGVLTVGAGTAIGQRAFMEARVKPLGANAHVFVGFTGLDAPASFAYMPPPQADKTELAEYFQTPANGGAYVAHTQQPLGNAKHFSIAFAARTSGAVMVAFSNKHDDVVSGDKNAIEVVIGGWGDRKSLVRRGMGARDAAEVHSQRGHLLAGQRAFKWFWIAVDDDRVRVGTGQIVGKNEFMKAHTGRALSGDVYALFGGFEAPVNFRSGAAVQAAHGPAAGAHEHHSTLGNDQAFLVPIKTSGKRDTAYLTPIKVTAVDVASTHKAPLQWNLHPEYQGGAAKVGRKYKLVPQYKRTQATKKDAAAGVVLKKTSIKKAASKFLLKPEYE